MSLLSDVIERLRALMFFRRQEQDLADEVRFHLEQETEKGMRQGMTMEEARRSANLAFGGEERFKEAVRDARGVRPFQDLGADVRYAFRALRRNPGFTTAAVLVLGIGIGASTAIFSVVDAVLLADLPYPGGDRLVQVFEKNSPTNIWGVSAVDYEAIRDQQQSFEVFGVAQSRQAALSGEAHPEQVIVGRVTPGFFRALSVIPAYGRLINVEDEPAAAPRVVVVSHALAERSLGGAAGAVGRALTIDGVSHTVVGVLPPGIDQLAGLRATAWPALTMTPPTRRGPFGYGAIGRLKPGVTLQAAEQDLAGISKRIYPLWASSFKDETARLTPIPLREVIVGTADRQIGLFAGAIGLVLLVAIANVATLMLVRSSARDRELAVRAALGATRTRLAQLVITESLLLTGLAGIVALLVAALGIRLTARLTPDLPRLLEVGLHTKGVFFALGAVLVSGILVGLAPVSQVLRGHSAGSIRSDNRVGSSKRSNAVRGALVVAEFALALPLLLGTGLLLTSFLRLQRVNPGYDPHGVLSVNIALPVARYPDSTSIQAFWRTAEARALSVSGVSVAGLSTALPPDNPGDINNFNLIAHPVPSGTAEPVSPWSFVSPGYFRTMGVPLLEGRSFNDADATGPPVIIVSRSWSARYFPKESAVGQELVSGGCYDCPRTTIVGVVGDIKYVGLAGSGEAAYDPVVQNNIRTMNLMVRTNGSSPVTARALSDAIGGLDPELPLGVIQLEDRLSASLANPFRLTTVIAAFAAAAVLLAALGVFGLMSYVVRQRRREIGVRLALGAQPSSVTRMVVGRGVRFALLGSAIGLGLVALEVRWLRALLFQVAPTDPVIIASATGVLLLAAVLACWLPGRRAARIKPVEALSGD